MSDPAKARKQLNQLFKKYNPITKPNEQDASERHDPRNKCCWNGGRFFDALKAIVTRQLFLLHALLAIWRVTLAMHTLYWLLCCLFFMMICETFMVLIINHAKEWNM